MILTLEEISTNNNNGIDDRLRRAEESDSMASLIIKSQTLLLKEIFARIKHQL